MTFEGHFGDLLTVVTLCAQLTRDLLAIAKFLVATDMHSRLALFATVSRFVTIKCQLAVSVLIPTQSYNTPYCRRRFVGQ